MVALYKKRSPMTSPTFHTAFTPPRFSPQVAGETPEEGTAPSSTGIEVDERAIFTSRVERMMIRLKEAYADIGSQPMLALAISSFLRLEFSGFLQQELEEMKSTRYAYWKKSLRTHSEKKIPIPPLTMSDFKSMIRYLKEMPFSVEVKQDLSHQPGRASVMICFHEGCALGSHEKDFIIRFLIGSRQEIRRLLKQSYARFPKLDFQLAPREPAQIQITKDIKPGHHVKLWLYPPVGQETAVAPSYFYYRVSKAVSKVLDGVNDILGLREKARSKIARVIKTPIPTLHEREEELPSSREDKAEVEVHIFTAPVIHCSVPF